MKHWEYRVMKRKYKEDMKPFYAIYEVYYSSHGEITAWTEDCMQPTGDSRKELEQDFGYMKEAFHKRTLDYNALMKKQGLKDDQ